MHNYFEKISRDRFIKCHLGSLLGNNCCLHRAKLPLGVLFNDKVILSKIWKTVVLNFSSNISESAAYLSSSVPKNIWTKVENSITRKQRVLTLSFSKPYFHKYALIIKALYIWKVLTCYFSGQNRFCIHSKCRTTASNSIVNS